MDEEKRQLDQINETQENHSDIPEAPEVMDHQVSMEEYEQDRKTSQEEQPAEPQMQSTTAQPENKTEAKREMAKVKLVHRKKKGLSFRKVIAACLVVSICGGLSIGASYAWGEHYFKSAPTQSTDVVADGSGDTSQTQVVPVGTQDGYMTAADVVEKVAPSVVNISISATGTTNYFGFLIPYESEASGSGIIFDIDDEYVYIVTNNHVVSGANQISVSVTGVEAINAEVVGTDSMAELAVIKAKLADFHTAGIDNVVPATFGDSDSLRVGDSVIAIGNALGQGKSATDGMISILNQTINVDGRDLNVIQTSANINPGNSGGALVNMKGEVIGINTAKSENGEAIGYAIPSNTVKEVMAQLKDYGTTPRPYLGILGSDITNDVADLYKLPVGVLVRDVMEDGGAAEAGLTPGDIIVGLNGQTVMNMDQLTDILSGLEVGSTVSMDIIRNGNTSMTLQVPIYDANVVSNGVQQ